MEAHVPYPIKPTKQDNINDVRSCSDWRWKNNDANFEGKSATWALTKKSQKPDFSPIKKLGRRFNRSLVRTGVRRGVLNSPSNPQNCRKKEKILEKGTFKPCAKLWYAPNPGSKEIWKKNLFFSEKCFVASPFQKSAPTQADTERLEDPPIPMSTPPVLPSLLCKLRG